MKKRYPFLLLLVALLGGFFNSLSAQCNLQVATTSFESRCTATGSILVSVSGGSGQYNYKAEGALKTPFTSSSNITGLRPGIYTVTVKDVASNCQQVIEGVEVGGSYSDPRFALTKTDVTCLQTDGTLTVTNLQFGRNPFSYTIIAPSPANLGTTNNTGLFTNLIAGEYFVQLRDSCGGIQVRRTIIEQYSWAINSVAVTKLGCDSASAVVNVTDNKGNTSGAALNGFSYGVVLSAGDTAWHPANSFTFFLGKKRAATLVAKDNCGTVRATTWNLPAALVPSVGTVSTNNSGCGLFTADVTDEKNLTAPKYYLFNNANQQVDWNSTGVFTGLAYANYTINIVDVCYDTTIVKKLVAAQPVPNVSNTVTVSNTNCTTFSATITGQVNLTSPQFSLYTATDQLITSNTTGVFTNVLYGSYYIITKDGCTGALIRRDVTLAKPIPFLKQPVVSSTGCGTFTVKASGTNLIAPQYCLYNADGTLVTCNTDGIFTGLPARAYCLKAISCGDTTAAQCFSTVAPKPSVSGTVQITNETCTGFTASITGQTNITNAQYCLFNSNGDEVSCNTSGVFAILSYGSYCIKVKDGCTDTTITRCFTQTRTVPTVSGTMEQLNSTCSSFTAKVTGANLTNPQYFLYNSNNVLVSTNTTGVFDALAYGAYCVQVQNQCGETFKICQTFSPAKGLTVTTSKSCTIGSATISVSFSNQNGPFVVHVIHPNGLTVFTDTSASNKVNAILAALPDGLLYKVIGWDGCGQKDSAFFAPDASKVTKAIAAFSKCPSSTWANGSGDLSITSTSNLYTLRPQIIKKNGASFVRNYSSANGGTYMFNDLEPATYIVEYTMPPCAVTLYDTFALKPYSYPTQGQSAIYQCDNNSFSLGADVSGGVTPYTYQIIGSLPEAPSITSVPQSNPVFTINNGTTYSLVRLRTLDACGNATLSDLSVLPLQNIVVTASALCFYDTVNLSVPEIPNATYKWYKKRSETDSLLVSSNPNYFIPFFEPEHSATYVAKVSVNHECLVRLAYFNLSEDCGRVVLPLGINLTAKTVGAANKLTWVAAGDGDVERYEIEVQPEESKNFKKLATVESKKAKGSAAYEFNHTNPSAGKNTYRLKLVYAGGKWSYSNHVQLANSSYKTTVFPNPSKRGVWVQINGSKEGAYDVYLVNMRGQVVFTKAIKNSAHALVAIERNNLPAGMYFLSIKNKLTGSTEYHKIIFE